MGEIPSSLEEEISRGLERNYWRNSSGMVREHLTGQERRDVFEIVGFENQVKGVFPSFFARSSYSREAGVRVGLVSLPRQIQLGWMDEGYDEQQPYHFSIPLIFVLLLRALRRGSRY